MKNRIALVPVLISLERQVSAQCQPVSHYPGLSFSESNPDQKVELVMDADGSVIKIKKTDDCFHSVFDVASQTTYLEDLNSTYTSTYSQQDATRLEEQKISSWFEWKREESSTQASVYTAESELLEVFVPGSIAACYISVLILGLILLCITKLFCRSGKVLHDLRNPAAEAKKQL